MSILNWIYCLLQSLKVLWSTSTWWWADVLMLTPRLTSLNLCIKGKEAAPPSLWFRALRAQTAHAPFGEQVAHVPFRFAPIEENVHRNKEMVTKKMIRSLNRIQILLLAKIQAQCLICQKQEAELVDVTPTLLNLAWFTSTRGVYHNHAQCVLGQTVVTSGLKKVH